MKDEKNRRNMNVNDQLLDAQSNARPKGVGHSTNVHFHSDLFILVTKLKLKS